MYSVTREEGALAQALGIVTICLSNDEVEEDSVTLVSGDDLDFHLHGLVNGDELTPDEVEALRGQASALGLPETFDTVLEKILVYSVASSDMSGWGVVSCLCINPIPHGYVRYRDGLATGGVIEYLGDAIWELEQLLQVAPITVDQAVLLLRKMIDFGFYWTQGEYQVDLLKLPRELCGHLESVLIRDSQDGSEDQYEDGLVLVAAVRVYHVAEVMRDTGDYTVEVGRRPRGRDCHTMRLISPQGKSMATTTVKNPYEVIDRIEVWCKELRIPHQWKRLCDSAMEQFWRIFVPS